MSTILSFDISSTTIGYAVLKVNSEIEYIDSGIIIPPQKGDIIERLANTRNDIQNLILSINPDNIVIEDLVQFMKFSTAKTVIALASFNRMISLLAYDFLKKSPEFYSVLSIRHGLKTDKVLPKKEEIPELVAKYLNIKFPYYYNKKNKIHKIHITSYDRADAIAVGLYHGLILTNKIKKK